MDELILPVLIFFGVVGLIAVTAGFGLRRASDLRKATAWLHLAVTAVAFFFIAVEGSLANDDDVAGAILVAVVVGLPVYLGLWYENARRSAKLPAWMTADMHVQAPRIMLAAYLAGTWYITAARIVDSVDFFRHGASLLLLLFAPVTLLVGPWAVLANGDGVLPILLTYGVFGAWYAGRQLLATIRPRS
jgi:hypothetical protein